MNPVKFKRPIRLLLIVLLFCNITTGLLAQCDSVLQMAGTGLTSVHVFDQNNIIACGDAGSIIKSYDGGRSWRRIASSNSTMSSIRRLYFPGGGTGYATTGTSTILKTFDQGESWFPIHTGSEYDINDAFFINKDTGFFCGDEGTFSKTTDGGLTWNTASRIAGSDATLSTVCFTNDSTGFVAGNFGDFFRTTNGGQSWTAINTDSFHYSLTTYRIVFKNDTVGFAMCDYGYFLQTTDGGYNWKRQDMYLDGKDIFFWNDQLAFVTGGSSIWKSVDGGFHWSPTIDGTYAMNFTAIHADPQHQCLVAVGMNGAFLNSSGRSIVSSTDSGQTWTFHSANISLNYYSGHMLNDSTVYITGENGYTFKTKDYGESWAGLNFGSGNPAIHIYFINEAKGFIAGNKDLYNYDELYETADSGKTWSRNSYDDANGRMKTIFFWDSLKGMIVTEIGMFKTIDGGQSWVKKYSMSQGWSGTFTKSGRCFVTASLHYYLSTDFGETWEEIPVTGLAFTEFLQNGYLYNDTLGFLSGNDVYQGNGIMYRTVDGGKSWTRMYHSIYIAQVKSFYFKNAAEGWILTGSTNGFYQTKDSGLTWTQLYLPTSDAVYSMMASAGQFYFCGSRGSIVKKGAYLATPVTGYINGPLTACAGTTTIYRMGAVPGTNYNWSLPGNGIEKRGTSTDTITWTQAGTYMLSVFPQNNCGQGATTTITITVYDVVKPVITRNDSVLTVSAGESYQWYRNGLALTPGEGGNAQSITAGTNAVYYWAVVTNANGCTIASDKYYYLLPYSLCDSASKLFQSNVSGDTYQWQSNDGSGYKNIEDNDIYIGVTTYNLFLKTIPSTYYGTSYRCLATTGTVIKPSIDFIIKFSNKWTGSKNSVWEDPGNWACGRVPGAYEDVIIAPGAFNSPVISSNAVCRSLKISPGLSITVVDGFSLSILH